MAAFAAGVVFAVLPMQTESVAWVTGRVDSMPAFFYLAAFLLYCRWRADGGPGVVLVGGRCLLRGTVLEAEHHDAGAGARGV